MSHDLTLVKLSSIIWLLRIGVFHCNLFSLFYMGHPQVEILCFYLPHNITWTLHWGAILNNRWEFFAVFHDPDKSCNHEHCDSGDMFSIQHVTSREYVFKGLWKFPGWKSLTLRHHLPCLVAIGLVQVEIWSICYVTLRDIITWLRDQE